MTSHLYNSIENHYNTKIIEKLECSDAIKLDWVALEKIHGSNFSIFKSIKNDELKFCKRSVDFSPH